MDQKVNEMKVENTSVLEQHAEVTPKDKTKKVKKAVSKLTKKGKKSEKPEWIRQLNQFPLKSLSSIAMVIGAFIFIGYMVHIDNQPDLEAVNLPMLFGRVFYCGALVCVGLAFLLVPGFTCTYLATDDSSPPRGLPIDKATRTKRLTNVGLVLMAQFVLPVLVFCFSLNGESGVQNWIARASFLLLLGAIVSLFIKFKIPSIRAKVIADKALAGKKSGRLDSKPGKSPAAIDDIGAATVSKKNEPIKAWEFGVEYIIHAAVLCATMLFSIAPLFILAAILDSAPKTANSGWLVFWMIWVFIALMNTAIALVTEFSAKEKAMVGAIVVIVVLTIAQVIYLPFVLAIRLAGIGQIAHADLELSDHRCEIVLNRLKREGIADKLICNKDENGLPIEFAPAKTDSSVQKNVLKDVLILSNVGKDFFVEMPIPAVIPIAEGNKPGTTSKSNEADKPKTATTDSVVPKNNTQEVGPLTKEAVVRIHIPKTEAEELIHTQRPILSHFFFGENTKSQGTH